MRRMCVLIAAAVVAMGVRGAVAQVGDARKPQVDAAVANAVDGLYREVSRVPVSGGMTVGQVVEKVGGREDLMKTLQGAQEIGGPRWLDDQTAQVRLEISGTRVAHAVLQIAASNPRKTPVKADVLAVLLSDWDRKTFGAVGTSTGAAAIEAVRPVTEDAAWAGVPEQARREAIAMARANAAATVVDQVRRVELKPGRSVGSVMDAPNSRLRGDLDRYLTDRPVTGVQFQPNQQVEVGLSVPGAEVAGVVRGSVQGMNDPQLADVDWNRVGDEIARAVGSGIGRGSVGSQVSPAPVAAAGVVKVPAQPPDWVWTQLEASASARGGDSALKCARAAERAATDKLEAQVNALTLDAGMTVGEAGRQDSRIAEAVARGMGRAKVYKSDYHADGSATVYVSLDLRDVWDQLRQL